MGTAVSLQITATDSASGQTLTYSASGLPPGLSISSSGLVSGTPTAAGTYSVTVTATDTTKVSGSATFTAAVSSASQAISFTAPATGTVGKSGR
jgi:kumamolisin